MTAAIGHPTLRLVRVRIINILLEDLKVGSVKEISESGIKKLIKKNQLQKEVGF